MKVIQTAWNLFDTNKKKNSVKILILIIIGSFLEILGIGLIIPIISILFDDKLLNSYAFLSFLNVFDKKQLITISLILFVLTYLLKNLYLFFCIVKQTNFIYSMKLQLMNDLYKKYLKNKYEFHINNNTSILYRNIQIESQILTTNIIQPLMILITDTSFFFLITLFSLFLFPFESLIFLSFICLTLLLYYRFLKNIVSSWGEKRQYYSGLTNKIAMESLNSIKTIKHLSKEDYFITNYSSLTSLLVENESKNTIV